jgi:hypothetical protein
MVAQPFLTQVLRESDAYLTKKPRHVPSANSPNLPALGVLYQYAVSLREKESGAKRFNYEGAQYRFVWLGRRLCVMHSDTARVLVGDPGSRND